MAYRGYKAGGQYGSNRGYGYGPPHKRGRKDEPANPCSGRYEGEDKTWSVQIMVDVDNTRKFSEAIGTVSGTLIKKAKKKSGDDAFYFAARQQTVSFTAEQTGALQRHVTADIKVTHSDGRRSFGEVKLDLSQQRGGQWQASVELDIPGRPSLSFKKVPRKSLFFKDVALDIDYTDKIIWPTVELSNLANFPVDMKDRKIDVFSAFEDAGVKIQYDQSKSEKVEEPKSESSYTEDLPWTKEQMYTAMDEFFKDLDKGADENIWCMMATTPPDKRFMGYSFDKEGKVGFGIFTGHSSFSGLDSGFVRVKNKASQRLLHYLVHECGHCLGLKHPFEIGDPESLSWMNYAWKYDLRTQPGAFYREFDYSFSEKELLILRHSPSKAFKSACERSTLSDIMGDAYKVKSQVADQNLVDDDSDDEEESESGYGAQTKKPTRKIVLDLKFKPEPIEQGELFAFEARIKNVGKLPAMVESDLSLESGNLKLFLTGPDSVTQAVDPFVQPIQSGYSRPLVLYTSEDNEGSDRYSELVVAVPSKQGYQFSTPGKYRLRAQYSAGRYRVTSDTYTIYVKEGNELGVDQATLSEVSTYTTLQASGTSRFQNLRGYWEKLLGMNMDYKRKKIPAIVGLMQGLTKASDREPASSGGRRARAGQPYTVKKAAAVFGVKKLLKETSDIVTCFKTSGVKLENLDYSRLVFARGELHLREGKVQEADVEFNQMLADLLQRGAKYDTLTTLSKKWNKMKNPTSPDEKKTPGYLQRKTDKMIAWEPSYVGDGESDLSGIGLGMPFVKFDTDHLEKASRVINILFDKYSDTKQVTAVISYADKLQKGREVNSEVLKWAMEAFIVHSVDAKRAGLRYPEPQDRDPSLLSQAAMIETKRIGAPNEQWMNYWRCDAEFNYHHSHFHTVYQIGRFLNWDNEFVSDTPLHLLRQGELFGYMHTQILARYDAERESWGLLPCQPLDHREKVVKFNAGVEFHSEKLNFAPRPNTKWTPYDAQQSDAYEVEYKKAVDRGYASHEEERMDPNIAGHILEASSRKYQKQFGSLHNQGHMNCGVGIPRNMSTYMYSTSTAVMDPIFFRWHKRIDDLWQYCNETLTEEIGKDAPGVTITADDVLIDESPTPPEGFNSFEYGGWTSASGTEPTTIHTVLVPPVKKFEWDLKSGHEAFYYHLRMKRNERSDINDALNLTFRIFICPKKRMTERTRWIEMDKFVYHMDAGVKHAVVTRADKSSSVIKRLPHYIEQDFEGELVKTAPGFCECGWPYAMLLPRGTSKGEEYVLFVMATDNNLDQIGLRTKCGSMSFCGAKGEKYPDKRRMGYPFTGPLLVHGDRYDIPQAFDQIENAAYKSFIIKSNIYESENPSFQLAWSPLDQLGVEGEITDKIRRSRWTGRFRVLIDGDAASATHAGAPRIRFQGRGIGGGSYGLSDVTIVRRVANPQYAEKPVPVLFAGKKDFDVPENELLSDKLDMRFQPGEDYFVEFTARSPGLFFYSRKPGTITDFYSATYSAAPADWYGGPGSRRSRHCYCISGIMMDEEA